MKDLAETEDLYNSSQTFNVSSNDKDPNNNQPYKRNVVLKKDWISFKFIEGAFFQCRS